MLIVVEVVFIISISTIVWRLDLCLLCPLGRWVGGCNCQKKRKHSSFVAIA